MNDEQDIAQWLQSWQQGAPGALPTPYRVPDPYFEALTGQLLNRLDASEPALTGGLSSPYRAPGPYFSQLEAAIQEKIDRPMRPTRRMRWHRWTAAAVLTGILLWGATRWVLVHDDRDGHRPAVSTAQIRGFDNQELTEFAEEPAEQFSHLPQVKKTIELNQLLEGLSSQELQNFLNENAASGGDVF